MGPEPYGHVVTATFADCRKLRCAQTREVWRHDYGMTLKIEGLNLPEWYEVDFALKGSDTSVTLLGGRGGRGDSGRAAGAGKADPRVP